MKVSLVKQSAPAAKNGCTRPPHFPPHCGCPAGYSA